MQHLDRAARFTPPPAGEPNHYVEHLRAPTMSVGTYCIPRGGLDDQSPHDEDEVYVVVAGRGLFTSGGVSVPVGLGTTLFVPAHEEHRFHDVTDDLVVVVVFAPPFSG